MGSIPIRPELSFWRLVYRAAQHADILYGSIVKMVKTWDCKFQGTDSSSVGASIYAGIAQLVER